MRAPLGLGSKYFISMDCVTTLLWMTNCAVEPSKVGNLKEVSGDGTLGLAVVVAAVHAGTVVTPLATRQTMSAVVTGAAMAEDTLEEETSVAEAEVAKGIVKEGWRAKETEVVVFEVAVEVRPDGSRWRGWMLNAGSWT